MKVLFVSYMNLNQPGTIGITKKIHSQKRAFEKNSVNVDYVWAENNCIKSSLEFNDLDYFGCDDINEQLLKLKNLNLYDVVYIRYARFSIKLIRLLKILNKMQARIVLEIPTYPFWGEEVLCGKKAMKAKQYTNAIRIVGRCALNYYYSKIVHRYVDRIVTYSKDQVIWGIPTLPISNGIDVESIKRIKNYSDTEDLNCICVSSCVNWHGYDRFLVGLGEYYHKKGNHRVVKFHIIGDGSEIPLYKDIVQKYNLEDYVFFYGTKTGVELDAIFEDMHLAIDALGRHRSGVYYNSSLKGKEYIARGLPIISGVETELDYDASYLYYYRVMADDSAIDIGEVIKFYDTLPKDENMLRAIREYAEQHFSYEKVMQPVLDYLESDIKQNKR